MRNSAFVPLPREPRIQAARRCGACLRPLRLLLAGAALAALPAQRIRAAENWDPVDPADLAATASAMAPGADMEYLWRRSELLDDVNGTYFQYYVRAKIYTPRGVEKAGLLSIEYPDATRIRRLVARVVKVDGTALELKKSDFFESTLARQGRAKWKKTTFAFPSLAPGDLVEYRWAEETQFGGASQWLYCQWDVPVREFRLKLEAEYANLSVAWFNCGEVTRSKPNKDTVELTMRNIPPYAEEDHMMAEREWRGWIRLVYLLESNSDVEVWKELFGRIHRDFLSRTKPNDALRKKAAELTAGARTDAEKLERLYNYCQNEILNLTWADTPEAREARRKGKQDSDQSARQVLKRGRGWDDEVTDLFAGLARAAGFDARSAHNAMTSDLIRVRRIPHGWDFLTEYAVAIRLDGKWAFFSPGEAFVPFGLRHRLDEGAIAVIADAKEPLYEAVPVSPAAKSLTVRKGRLTVDGAGELSGEIEETMTGHTAIVQKNHAWDEGQEKIDNEFKEAIVKRLPGAEVTEIRWENLRSTALPLVVRYTVRVPGYAEQIGRRLAVRPGFFEAGVPAVFTAEKRTHPIAFSYAWSERDDVEITVPAEYEPEAATAPTDVRVRPDVLSATYDVTYDRRRHTLIYKRDYAFGGDGLKLFQPEGYPLLKFLFERLRVSDTHFIVFNAKAPPTAATPEPPAGAPPAEAAPAANGQPAT